MGAPYSRHANECPVFRPRVRVRQLELSAPTRRGRGLEGSLCTCSAHKKPLERQAGGHNRRRHVPDARARATCLPLGIRWARQDLARAFAARRRPLLAAKLLPSGSIQSPGSPSGGRARDVMRESRRRRRPMTGSSGPARSRITSANQLARAPPPAGPLWRIH